MRLKNMVLTSTMLLLVGFGWTARAMHVTFGMGFEALMARDFGGSGLVQRDATGTNLQTFTDALGGAVAPPITQSQDPKRPFQVNGDTFTDFNTASNRSCDVQHNLCANLANGSSKGEFTVGQCDSQLKADCNNSASSATQTAFPTLFSSDANFDYFCDP